MEAIRIKLLASVAIILVVAASLPFVGLTESSADDRAGLVLDFGYWEAEWIEMPLAPGDTGDGVIARACAMKGYQLVRLDDGSVYSVDKKENLIGVRWGFYVLEGGKWKDADPASDIGGYRLVSWARASGAEAIIPGADYDGFGYYSYAEGGRSLRTGESLRVVTLAPSITESVVAVGGLKHIVGTDLYSDYPAAIRERKASGEIKKVGGYIDPNYESIIDVEPDLVFCDGGVGQHVIMADKLRKAGVNCVVLYDAVGIGAMYDNLWIIASALGMSDSARDLVVKLRGSIDIVSGIAGETNKRVFAALSADPSPWTAGSDTFMSDIIANAGGRNVFESQSSSWFMVGKEQIYIKQPQVIIVLSASNVDGDSGYDKLLDRLDPMWKSTPAYENGEVYVLYGEAADVMQRPGPRLAEATELVAKILNQEAFIDLDPLDAIPKYIGDEYHYYIQYTEDVFA